MTFGRLIDPPRQLDRLGPEDLDQLDQLGPEALDQLDQAEALDQLIQWGWLRPDGDQLDRLGPEDLDGDQAGPEDLGP